MTPTALLPLTMPKWGMSMTSGKVVAWLSAEGGPIAVGDELIEIETEKSVNVLEADTPGRLVRRVAAEGDELPVGALLGVLAAPGAEATPEAIDEFVEGFCAAFVPPEEESEVDAGPVMLSMEGVSVAYRLYPGDGAPDAAPMVLIHGFGGDQEGWLFNVGELARDRPVYTLDLPGHGRSSREVGDGSPGFLSGVVSRWLDELELGPVHLVGHSLGTAVAIELARAREVLSLALIAGLGPGTAVDAHYVEGFTTADRRRQLKPFLLQLFADERFVTRDMVETVLRAKRIESTSEALKRIAEASILGVDTDPMGGLESLDVPIQVIWGRRDRVATATQTERLPPSIPVEIIEGAGHMVHIEAASTVNRLLRELAAGRR